MHHTPHKHTVAVGMSGGIDSTIAAYLLVKQGYRVVGLTMRIWDGSVCLPEIGRPGCFGPGEADDAAAAAAAAQRLGVPHHCLDLAADYRAKVLDHFRGEYLAGRTPNPCVRCNRALKFGALLERARACGIEFDCFATGHYARVQFDAAHQRYLLLRARDPAKDQSYFLSQLSQAQLAELIFPLGGMTKTDVKNLAREMGWAELADKPESQDFIESGDYTVLFEAGDCRPGPLVDSAGTRLGEHRGIVHYTIGQRRGLGLSGAAEPLYVIRLDAAANTVVVGTQSELFASQLKARDLNWISIPAAPVEALPVQAKIRYKHKAAQAAILPDPSGSADTVGVVFDHPQSAVAPGQTVVFYDGDAVVGGGTIVGTRL